MDTGGAVGQGFDIRVISLRDARERRQHMAALFAGSGADWSYFDAIAGASLPAALPAYDRQRRLRLLGYDLRQNEIACFLSHREVWRHAVASGCGRWAADTTTNCSAQSGNSSPKARAIMPP